MLEYFSSVEELAPVFEYGGQIVFVPLMVHRGTCIVKEKGEPWKIVMWALYVKGLNDQKETLVHEFVHLFHKFQHGYVTGPRQNRFFHEVARELILHPSCSIIFESDEARDTPFWDYYRGLVSQLIQELKNGACSYKEAQKQNIIRQARILDL